MNHGKPINSNLTKLRYIIGLYDDRKIQIYDKCQIYGIYWKAIGKYHMLNLIFDWLSFLILEKLSLLFEQKLNFSMTQKLIVLILQNWLF